MLGYLLYPNPNKCPKSLFLFVRQHRREPEAAGLLDTSECAGGFYMIILALTFTPQSGLGA